MGPNAATVLVRVEARTTVREQLSVTESMIESRSLPYG